MASRREPDSAPKRRHVKHELVVDSLRVPRALLDFDQRQVSRESARKQRVLVWLLGDTRIPKMGGQSVGKARRDCVHLHDR